MRVFVNQDPFMYLDDGKPWPERGQWPCRWIACPSAGPPPFVVAFRLRFTIEQQTVVRAHVTADERYELYLDGAFVGRGSERGDRENWFYESYDLTFTPGEHVLVARVWALGDLAPYAQMTVQPGFLFAPENAFVTLLGTGNAPWQAKRLTGIQFAFPHALHGTGADFIIDGSQYSWGFERGLGRGWRPALPLAEGANADVRNEVPPIHLLRPGTLPPMVDVIRSIAAVRHVSAPSSPDTQGIPIRSVDDLVHEHALWEGIVARVPVTVPAHTVRRVILDLEEYSCAYPVVVTDGGRGGYVRLHWAETLFAHPTGPDKGHRNEIEGKYFRGYGDTFLPDGGSGRLFNTLWWQCGRYLELFVQTLSEPLIIERVDLRETHYPLVQESSFETDDIRLLHVSRLALRTLEMCMHETYIDCPYYEQLQYVGDTRLDALATYVLTRDDRLPRKALCAFDVSRRHDGLTQSRYPSRVRQTIPPFALWWVAMVYDYALWRDDPAFVAQRLPGVRNVVEGYLRYVESDGLLHAPRGWNYVDWAIGWHWGVPPGGESGTSAVLHWQLVLVLTLMAQLEGVFGDPELATRARRLAAALADSGTRVYWSAERGLLADDPAHDAFSEHTQCLALLSGMLKQDLHAQIARNLVAAQDLTKTTIYFSHYLFETLRLIGRVDVLYDRLQLWFEHEARGLRTTIEHPEPTRSDCHAWGAHPVYHDYATLLGIRPAAFGFRQVQIAPQLGPLAWARGTLVHPRGEICAEFCVEAGTLRGRVVLPPGVCGTLVWGTQTVPLASGEQVI